MREVEAFVKEKYKIIGVAGQGAKACVYKVQEYVSNIIYALKVSEDKNVLRKEALVLQNSSCNIFPQFHEWMEGELAYLVLEYVEGCDLQGIMDNGMVFHVDEAMWIMEQILKGLDYLHKQNPCVVYRDLKPANILAETSGRIYLTDLGSVVSDAMEVGNDTRSGTYGYAAPEQFWQGMKATPDWDVYAAGKLLGYLLTGKNPAIPPYQVEAFFEKDRRIPAAFLEVIHRCLSENREARYENAGELLKALKIAKDEARGKYCMNRRQKIKYKKCIWLSEYRRIF